MSSDIPSGQLICWGNGGHGQNARFSSNHITQEDKGCFVEPFTGSDSNWQIKLVSCGSSHTVAVTETNAIYVWGNGIYGQLGVGDNKSYSEPLAITLHDTKHHDSPVKGVSCGGRHTVVWLQNGLLFSFGNNTFSQLGFDFKTKHLSENQASPYLVNEEVRKPVVQASCGDKHTIILFNDGTIACSGSNSNGQIGDKSCTFASSVTEIDGLPSVSYVTAGANHSLAIDVEGQAWVWGLGTACGERKTDLFAPTLCHLPRKNAVMAAGGQSHSILLTANGNIYTFGKGTYGQLGHGSEIEFLEQPKRVSTFRSNIVKISSGDTYSSCLTNTGQLFMWGKNNHVIMTNTDPAHIVWIPIAVNTRGLQFSDVSCGSWHIAVVTGHVGGWEKQDFLSDDDEVEDAVKVEGLEKTNDVLPPLRLASREQTSISIADFYASSPSPTRQLEKFPKPTEQSPSQDVMSWNEVPIPNSHQKVYMRVEKPKTPLQALQPFQSVHPPLSSRITEESSQAENKQTTNDSSSQGNNSSVRNVKEMSQHRADQIMIPIDSTVKADMLKEMNKTSNRSSNRSTTRVALGIPRSDKLPLKIKNSSAVDLRNSSSDELNKFTNVSPYHMKIKRNKQNGDGQVGRWKNTTFNRNRLDLEMQDFTESRADCKDRNSAFQHSRHLIQLKGIRRLPGSKTVSFSTEPKHYSLQIEQNLGLSRERSIIQPSVLEFPETVRHSPKYKRTPQPLRMETVTRENTMMSERNRKVSSKKVTFVKSHSNSLNKPLLMNTIFARGLKEIRSTNHRKSSPDVLGGTAPAKLTTQYKVSTNGPPQSVETLIKDGFKSNVGSTKNAFAEGARRSYTSHLSWIRHMPASRGQSVVKMPSSMGIERGYSHVRGLISSQSVSQEAIDLS